MSIEDIDEYEYIYEVCLFGEGFPTKLYYLDADDTKWSFNYNHTGVKYKRINKKSVEYTSAYYNSKKNKKRVTILEDIIDNTKYLLNDC